MHNPQNVGCRKNLRGGARAKAICGAKEKSKGKEKRVSPAPARTASGSLRGGARAGSGGEARRRQVPAPRASAASLASSAPPGPPGEEHCRYLLTNLWLLTTCSFFLLTAPARVCFSVCSTKSPAAIASPFSAMVNSGPASSPPPGLASSKALPRRRQARAPAERGTTHGGQPSDAAQQATATNGIGAHRHEANGVERTYVALAHSDGFDTCALTTPRVETELKASDRTSLIREPNTSSQFLAADSGVLRHRANGRPAPRQHEAAPRTDREGRAVPRPVWVWDELFSPVLEAFFDRAIR